MGFRRVDRVKISGSSADDYEEYTVTTLYVERPFGTQVNTITITNDSETDVVQFSYDGATLHGEVKSLESITVQVAGKLSVYIKGTTGGDKVRIWAW